MPSNVIQTHRNYRNSDLASIGHGQCDSGSAGLQCRQGGLDVADTLGEYADAMAGFQDMPISTTQA